MFGNLLGKKDTESNNEKEVEQEAITQKVSTMNLTDMRTYVRGKLLDFDICEYGLNEVLKKLTMQNESTQKFYINSDDMDSKKKKAFDLVITMSTNKNVSVITVELMQKFIEVYKEILDTYDKDHKEIYNLRLIDAIEATINTVNALTELNDKMSILTDN